jgi:hypothetical protein
MKTSSSNRQAVFFLPQHIFAASSPKPRTSLGSYYQRDDIPLCYIVIGTIVFSLTVLRLMQGTGFVMSKFV